MNKTLWSAAVALGIAVGAAGAPPSAFAGGHSFSSATIGVSNYGGHGTNVRYGWFYSSGYRHGWGWGGNPRYYRYPRGYYYHDHHGTADALLGFMIGALAVGAIAAAHDRDPGPSYSDEQPSALGCHVVNRIGPDHTGQTVKFGATMCYDRSGTPYIVQGSQHIIERY